MTGADERDFTSPIIALASVKNEWDDPMFWSSMFLRDMPIASGLTCRITRDRLSGTSVTSDQIQDVHVMPGPFSACATQARPRGAVRILISVRLAEMKSTLIAQL